MLGVAARRVRPGHPVADGHVGDAVADGEDAARAFETEHERQVDLVDAAAVVGVDVVDARRADLDDHFPGLGVRYGQVDGVQDIGATVLGDLDRAHPAIMPWWGPVPLGRQRGCPMWPLGGARPQRSGADRDERGPEHVQRHQRLRHAQRVLGGAERALGHHGRDEQPVAAPQRHGRADRVQREAERDEHAEVGEQQVGVQLGERGHRHVQPWGAPRRPRAGPLP